jgi:citrate lyase subunit beta/citryl-CoA lyase
MATRLQRLAPAIDGVTVSIADAERLRADTLRALRFGFGGKLCIHPRQVGLVHAAMMPSAEDVQWAERVIVADAESAGAAVRLDGRMIDLPVVLQARRTLARARSTRATL